ncbi:MAG TPA: hypothetical protein VFU21_16030 [Kofleriaceae bacterium]|nr:hypothetical protein [Kofleriaceae bacterium]
MGCGDDLRPPAGGDRQQQSSLEVLDPPGESIGLPFHGRVALRVLYRDPDGDPVPEAPVAFAPLASATESTGGATISDSIVLTDADGIAEVQLVAGAEQVNFRVQASALEAPAALFYIAVSEGGFTDLAATPEHVGFRADLARVEVRLYRSAELRCAELDIDAPPESVFPPRSFDDFGGVARYRNVTAGEGFALVAWAAAEPDGLPLAAGCVELGAAQVRPGRPLSLPVPVLDRAPALPAGLELFSSFDATPLVQPGDVWAVLDCPHGRAQLLIDCALDAQAPDGALDCAATGSSGLVDDVQALRGMVDPAGCRPSDLPGGAPSIDAVLDQAIGAPWPAGDALAALLAARRAPIQAFTLTSRLEAGSGSGAHHRLGVLAVISADAEVHAIDLVASDRAVVRQVAPVAVDSIAGRLEVAAHAFTLDYGRFARAAFAALGLTPAGLASRADQLGTALVQSVDADGTRGCPGLSDIVCTAAGRAATCLSAACQTARPALDDLMTDWWRALEGSGFDFSLTGGADLADRDADLTIDALTSGAWTATLRLSSGDVADLPGTFATAP